MSTTIQTRHILVAYDGTAPSRRALTRAGEIARTDDDVSVLSAVPYPSADYAPEQRAHQAALLEQAREALEGRGVAATTIAAEGDVATEVLAAARETGADLIVIALDRERFPHVPGSTTDTIVRLAPCDVYIAYAHPDPAAR